jgi:glycosyltransferase involved in cell wall biosynthesis
MCGDKQPKVTIMIPTYNQENFIGDCINSAAKQTYENIEIIVSDDNSVDNTSTIVRAYQEKYHNIRYYSNSKNLGRVNNYRKLLYELSTGDYVLNLDGDDYLTDINFIKNAINLLAIENYQPLMLVACKKFSNDPSINTLHKISTEVEKIKGLDYVLGVLDNYTFSHLTTIYKRSEALYLDFYREDIISSDIESLFRLALSGDVILCNWIVGEWRFLGNNESRGSDVDKYFNNLIWVNTIESDLKKKVSSSEVFGWKKKCLTYYLKPIVVLGIKGKRSSYIFKELVKRGLLKYALRSVSLIVKQKLLR